MTERPEPFRHLLEQALLDGDLTHSSLTLRSIPDAPAPREETRPDRPRLFSDDDDDDDDPFEHTLSEAVLPTRPFDLRRLAELSEQRSESPLLAADSSPHLDKATALDPTPFATTSLPPLEPMTGSLSDPSIPVAVGQSTRTWQVTHKGGEFSLSRLDELLEPSLGDLPPLQLPELDLLNKEGRSAKAGKAKTKAKETKKALKAQEAQKARAAPASQGEVPSPVVELVLPEDEPVRPSVSAGAGPVMTYVPDEPLDGLPLEHLDAVAAAATPGVFEQPNHRQRNMAQDLYLEALKALAAGDKKHALTHLRTASALDPTVDRYRMMIEDLAPSPRREAAPLPVVRGILLD